MTAFHEMKIAGRLPSPAGVALGIMNLCSSEDSSLESISQLVSTDPALAGRVLKLANSAASGQRPVASIHEAVIRLGIKAVSQLAVAFSLVDQYKQGACKAFDYERFWSYSLLMALASRSLAGRTRCVAAGDAFACGLLSNIGALALATAFPEKYSDLLTAYGQDCLGAERETFGIDRRECTAVMLQDFGIPKVLSESLFHHAAPTESGFVEGSRQSDLTWLFHTAASMAELGMAAEQCRSRLAASLLRLDDRLGLDGETASLFDAIADEWRQWGDLLNVSSALVPPFSNMSLEQDGASVEGPRRMLLVSACGHTAERIANLRPGRETRFQLQHVLDVASGLAAAVLAPLDVAIIDLDDATVEGLEFLRKVRASDWGRTVYLIGLADALDENTLRTSLEAGADTCLDKTFADSTFAAAVRAAERYLALVDAWRSHQTELKSIAADLAVSNRKLAQLARTDLVTGLPNRLAAMEGLERAWSAADRSNSQLTIMMLDLDCFKSINDMYGHAFGDKVLQILGERLRAEVRRNDIVCRIGGEEFLVVCQGQDLPSTYAAAERLRCAIASMEVVSESLEKVALTVSIGVALKDSSTQDINGLLVAADKAMYAAKQAGRNRTHTSFNGRLYPREGGGRTGVEH